MFGWLRWILFGRRPAVEPVKPNTAMNLKPGDLGIDVSKWNGVIDWKKVAADPQGIKFAILKASEGATSRDPRMLEYYTGAKKNGLLVSFYHFATFNSQDVVGDAKAEAKHFLQTIVNLKPDLPIVLDAETNKPLPLSRNQVLSYIKTFIGELAKAGYNFAIYASPGFLQSYLPPNHELGAVKLWVADYTSPINPTPGWSKLWLHQYTDKGKVSGIFGNVDINKVM